MMFLNLQQLKYAVSNRKQQFKNLKPHICSIKQLFMYEIIIIIILLYIS